MPLKSSRASSFILIAISYAIAMVSGIIIYHITPYAFWVKLFVADFSATVIIFILSVVFDNASVYDPYWSVLPIVVVVMLAVTRGLNPLRLLFLIAVCVWGVRLTANWAYTFENLNHQDWRYTMLKEKTKVFYPLVNLLGIHIFPTLVVYACILPVVFAFHMELSLNVGSIIFFAVSIFAVIIQGVSDVQVHIYRRHKKMPFIRIGLWKYSRHPNYLGEILMWWGIALAFTCVCPELWYLSSGAFVNTVMFFAISIPMADKRQSKKQGFYEYKKQTRMLLPIKK